MPITGGYVFSISSSNSYIKVIVKVKITGAKYRTSVYNLRLKDNHVVDSVGARCGRSTTNVHFHNF